MTNSFQSTLLIRRATDEVLGQTGVLNFNPRSSYEERPISIILRTKYSLFQSTLLIRRATHAFDDKVREELFQSTLLIRRATTVGLPLVAESDFNPRSSYEERHLMVEDIALTEISIHAPHTKSDGTTNWQ